MGTWSTAINGNDTFLDIYSNFMERYNQGGNPIDISKKIYRDFEELFEDYDDKNNALFGLAYAQWETRSLEPVIYKTVKEIIDTGVDLEVWKGSDKKTIEKRKSALNDFLIKISEERTKPKRRIKRKFEFHTIELVKTVAPDNKKTFRISEEFDKEYIHTSGLLMWAGGGGGVLYFETQGKFISAEWLDNQTLEVTHDPTIIFTKKEDNCSFYGDKVRIVYKAK